MRDGDGKSTAFAVLFSLGGWETAVPYFFASGGRLGSLHSIGRLGNRRPMGLEEAADGYEEFVFVDRF